MSTRDIDIRPVAPDIPPTGARAHGCFAGIPAQSARLAGQHGQLGGHGQSGPQSQWSINVVTSFRETEVGIDVVRPKAVLELCEALIEIVELGASPCDRGALTRYEWQQIARHQVALT